MTSQNLSKVIESMPENGIDFEYCAVQQTETRAFTLSNPTNSLVQFDISTDENSNSAFTLEPKNGKLPIFTFIIIYSFRHVARRAQKRNFHSVCSQRS